MATADAPQTGESFLRHVLAKACWTASRINTTASDISCSLEQYSLRYSPNIAHVRNTFFTSIVTQLAPDLVELERQRGSEFLSQDLEAQVFESLANCLDKDLMFANGNGRNPSTVSDLRRGDIKVVDGIVLSIAARASERDIFILEALGDGSFSVAVFRPHISLTATTVPAVMLQITPSADTVLVPLIFSSSAKISVSHLARSAMVKAKL